MHKNLPLINRAGYSFIEMVTVITVMAILMAISIMAMAPQIRQSKVGNAANVVVGDLQYAQSLAVRHRRPMSVIVQAATRQYTIRERDDATAVYRTRHLGQDSEFSLDTLSASDPLEFYPNGVALTTSEVRMVLGEYDRTVRLTRAGQIRIKR